MPGRVAVVAAAAAAVVWALTGACASSASASPMRKGPYLQDVAPDAITVMWQLTEPRPSRLVVDGPGSGSGPDERAFDVAAMPIAQVRVDRLAPHARYSYRVEVDGMSWSGELTTAPRLGDDVPITIVALGDSRDNPATHHELLARAMLDSPDLVIGNGDIVGDGEREADWQDFFTSAGDLLRDVPYYPTLGNHERSRRGAPAGFRSYFALPGGTADYYTCSYATTRLVMADSTATGAELDAETAWLDRELAAARRDPTVHHVIVAMHHAMFSTGRHGGSPGLRARWTPLFERDAVTMVISGHDHAYERAEHDGVHYFVSGGGGAPLYGRSATPSAADAAAVRTFESAWHYLRIRIRDDHVEVAAIRLDGTTIETTAWTDEAATSRPALTTRAPGGASALPAPPTSRPASSDDRAPDTEAASGRLWLWLLAAAAVAFAAAVVLIVRRR